MNSSENNEFWGEYLNEPLSEIMDFPALTPDKPHDDFVVNANRGLGPIEPEIASDILMPTPSDDFSVNANHGVGMTEQAVSGLNCSTPDEARDNIVLDANDLSISANQGPGTTEPRGKYSSIGEAFQNLNRLIQAKTSGTKTSEGCPLYTRTPLYTTIETFGPNGRNTSERSHSQQQYQV